MVIFKEILLVLKMILCSALPSCKLSKWQTQSVIQTFPILNASMRKYNTYHFSAKKINVLRTRKTLLSKTLSLTKTKKKWKGIWVWERSSPKIEQTFSVTKGTTFSEAACQIKPDNQSDISYSCKSKAMGSWCSSSARRMKKEMGQKGK